MVIGLATTLLVFTHNSSIRKYPVVQSLNYPKCVLLPLLGDSIWIWDLLLCLRCWNTLLGSSYIVHGNHHHHIIALII